VFGHRAAPTQSHTLRHTRNVGPTIDAEELRLTPARHQAEQQPKLSPARDITPPLPIIELIVTDPEPFAEPAPAAIRMYGLGQRRHGLARLSHYALGSLGH
jgi:hypothetical protein